MKRVEDLTGRRFGKLTVTGFAPRIKGKVAFECRCDCGGTHIVIADYLRRGQVRSCGCLSSRYKEKGIEAVKRKEKMISRMHDEVILALYRVLTSSHYLFLRQQRRKS